MSQRAVKPHKNKPNPVVSGMRTPVYGCYHIYSKVSDKNAFRSVDSDLTIHSMILDSISRRFIVVLNLQGKLVTLFQFLLLTGRSTYLHFVNRSCIDHRGG